MSHTGRARGGGVSAGMGEGVLATISPLDLHSARRLVGRACSYYLLSGRPLSPSDGEGGDVCQVSWLPRKAVEIWLSYSTRQSQNYTMLSSAKPRIVSSPLEIHRREVVRIILSGKRCSLTCGWKSRSFQNPKSCQGTTLTKSIWFVIYVYLHLFSGRPTSGKLGCLKISR